MEEPFGLGIEWKTLTSKFNDQGEEQRKQKWLYPRRNLPVKYNGITKTQAAELWDFYLARKGTFSAFNFFLANSDDYVGEYVGVGDGSTTVFNLPAENSSAYTVYVDGNAQTGGGVNYTFGDGTGEDGADKVTFTVAPSDGDYITFDFTGNLKVRCRFAEDILNFEIFYNRLVNAVLKLKGLLNA